MTNEEAQNCIRVLAAAYGAPDEGRLALWANVLTTLDYDRAETAIVAWVDTEPWWPRPSDINGLVRELGNHARFANQRALPAPTCDGTGWREIEEGVLPCDQCSPALSRLYADHSLLSRWRNGEAITRLVDMNTFVQPEAFCQPDRHHEDPEDRHVDWSVGRRIAWTAHAADNNTPTLDPDVFMRRLGKALT